MTLAAGAASVAPALAEADSAVEKALEILKTYDWGADRKALNPIDQAIVATAGHAQARAKLEKGLVDVLAGGISRSAQDYVCRKLKLIGTGQSVNALAALLPAENTSHIARLALERMPGEQALTAMREALPQVSDKLKPGLIGSLGKRRDRQSVKALSQQLRSSDAQVAQAAAHALALIGTPRAAKRLSRAAQQAPANLKVAAADACLICAEQLLAAGKKDEAVALYKELRGDDQPQQVKVAAMKGMLTAAAQR
jgi:HEAT repeat protein